MSKMGQWIVEQIEAGNVEYDDRTEEITYVKIKPRDKNRQGHTVADRDIERSETTPSKHAGERQLCTVHNISDRQVNVTPKGE